MSEVVLQTLPRFGPDAGDPFRFTWWNTPAGGEVWIEKGGRWTRASIIGRGRMYTAVQFRDRRGRRRIVKKLYSELRR